jgi:hypothetical protein
MDLVLRGEMRSEGAAIRSATLKETWFRCPQRAWWDYTGPRCLLRQQGSPVLFILRYKYHRDPIDTKNVKSLFQCEDYRPDGPFSLLPERKRR